LISSTSLELNIWAMISALRISSKPEVEVIWRCYVPRPFWTFGRELVVSKYSNRRKFLRRRTVRHARMRW
jgi:hypothetical protein